ncbi:MAG: recombinase RmuC [Planctomycetota bacterium]|jgi:DNA recombination protein RmuC
MDLLQIILSLLAVAGVVAIMLRSRPGTTDTAEAAQRQAEESRQSEARLTEAVRRSESASRESILQMAGELRKDHREAAEALRAAVDTRLHQALENTLRRLSEMQALTQRQIGEVRELTQKKLDEIRADNEKRLEQIRGTVDQKLNETLQTRLGEVIKQVSERLEQVHQQLGQVQTLASGVTDLQRTLAGVKTRGVFGEVMLKALLEEFLHPSQFECNFRPNARRADAVEFAVRLPNRGEDGEGEPVWLPIDAKFPSESYERLIHHHERGELEAAEIERRQLLTSVLGFARDIRDKYVAPPRTTDFAILYLPLESLFAEVVREPGFIERVQSECKVTLCSPTTLAAYLNALKMGFRTLAVQRQSAEIGRLLSVVRKQFQSFGEELAKVERKLEESRTAIARTVKRTRLMDGKLKGIEAAEELQMQAMLPLSEEEGSVDEADDPGD